MKGAQILWQMATKNILPSPNLLVGLDVSYRTKYPPQKLRIVHEYHCTHGYNMSQYFFVNKLHLFKEEIWLFSKLFNVEGLNEINQLEHYWGGRTQFQNSNCCLVYLINNLQSQHPPYLRGVSGRHNLYVTDIRSYIPGCRINWTYLHGYPEVERKELVWGVATRVTMKISRFIHSCKVSIITSSHDEKISRLKIIFKKKKGSFLIGQCLLTFLSHSVNS